MVTSTVTLINTGDYLADLAEWFRVDASDHPDVVALQQAQPIVVLALIVETAQGVVLIDAPLYDEEMKPIPGATQPAPLVDQLAQAGIPAERVAHIIITHAHFDHFNGLTAEVDGE